MKKVLGILLGGLVLTTVAQQTAPRPQVDPIQGAQQPTSINSPSPARPEQTKNAHDASAVFASGNAKAASPISNDQPNNGKISGFDFYRDPLNADRPKVDPAEIVQKETANRPRVMEAQRRLLESRYNLEPGSEANVKMSRGKPVPVGPTAKLTAGVSWDQLANMTPAEMMQRKPVSVSCPAASPAGKRGAGISQNAD
jgi:hypothetical protein